MRRNVLTQATVQLPSVTSKHIEHIKRASRRRHLCLQRRPNIGVNVTILFRDAGLAAMEAFEQRAEELGQRCGPRHSAIARQHKMLTRSDLTKLDKAGSALMDYLAEKPEHAALFACDPLAILKRLDKYLDNALLAKLSMLAQAGGNNADPVPNVRIGRMVVKVDREKGHISGSEQTFDPRHVE